MTIFSTQKHHVIDWVSKFGPMLSALPDPEGIRVTGRICHQYLLLVVKIGEMGASSDKIKTNKPRFRVTADVAL